MPAIDRSCAAEFRARCALGPQELGPALEHLVCSLMEVVPGITITRRNQLDRFKAQEIDLAFWNERDADGLVFLPQIVLVECKNWSRAVGSVEVSWFDRKVEDRGLDFGILVCANGITGSQDDLTSARNIVGSALKDGRRLLTLSVDHLLKLDHTDELIELMKEQLCELILNRSCI